MAWAGHGGLGWPGHGGWGGLGRSMREPSGLLKAFDFLVLVVLVFVLNLGRLNRCARVTSFPVMFPILELILQLLLWRLLYGLKFISSTYGSAPRSLGVASHGEPMFPFVRNCPSGCPKWLCQFPSPPAMDDNSCCPQPLLHVGDVGALGVGCSDWHMVLSPCGSSPWPVTRSISCACLWCVSAALLPFFELSIGLLVFLVYFGPKSFFRYAF